MIATDVVWFSHSSITTHNQHMRRPLYLSVGLCPAGLQVLEQYLQCTAHSRQDEAAVFATQERRRLSFPGHSAVNRPPAKQETQVQSLGQEDPLEKETATTPVLLPGKSMDRGAWQATVHGVAKETDRT